MIRFPKKNKYTAKKTSFVLNGEVMHAPSRLEAAVGDALEAQRLAGVAIDCRYQHGVNLGFGVRWKVDFSFTDVLTGETVWREAKGKWDAGALIKKRMWKNGAGPGRLEVWKGNYSRGGIKIFCSEVIYPTTRGGHDGKGEVEID